MPRFDHDGHPVAERIDTLIVAGWTGRDAAAVAHHVEELAALGVAPPSTIPLFYRASSALLDHHDVIEVVGSETSGEVEPLIVQAGGRRWLGVGSDHTDRALEAHSVALSKQICAKPCGSGLWPLDDIVDRLDTLELRAWIGPGTASAGGAGKRTTRDGGTFDEGDWTLYQEGTLATIRPLAELLDSSPLAADHDAHSTHSTEEGGVAAEARAMLCGTLPAIGGVRAAGAFRMELHDPSTGLSIRHAYTVRALPVVD